MQKPKQPDRRRYQQQRKPNDLSRCLAPLHSDHTLIAVVEQSLSSWLVAGAPTILSGRPSRQQKTRFDSNNGLTPGHQQSCRPQDG
jgi:hypothetical protein